MRKELTLQRASLVGMALGLLLIVQPYAEALFAIGFPVTLISIIGLTMRLTSGRSNCAV